MSTGHRWWGGCGSADSLYLDTGILLREWHQHPACEQHEASGRDTRRSEAWRRANGLTLCSSYCKYCYSRPCSLNLGNIAHFLLSNQMYLGFIASRFCCQHLEGVGISYAIWIIICTFHKRTDGNRFALSCAESAVIPVEGPCTEQVEQILQRLPVFGSVGACYQPSWPMKLLGI